MYLLRMPRWARMEAGQIKGHQFSIVASRINISRTVPSSLYVTQRIPSMIAKNQVFSTNFFGDNPGLKRRGSVMTVWTLCGLVTA